MAKKVVNPVDNEFEFDSGLDMNFDDLDGGFDVQDDRKPVESFKDGLIGSVKPALTDPGFLKRTFRDVFPPGFGQTLDLAERTTDEFSGLYDDVAKDVKPVLRDVKKATIKVIPKESKFVPKWMRDWAEKARQEQENEYKGNAQDDQRDTQVKAMLAEVFQQNQLQQAKQDYQNEKQDVQDTMRDAVQHEQHRDSLSALNKIYQTADSQLRFSQTHGLNYWKKDLELSLRRLMVQQDILGQMRELNEVTRAANKVLVKNSSLPDFAKLRNWESFKEMNRKKLFDTAVSGLFGGRNQYIDRFFKNIRQKVTSSVGAMTSGVRMGLMGMDSMSGMLDMPGMNKAELAGDLVGTEATQWAAAKAAHKLKRKFLDKSERLDRWNTQLSDFSENVTRQARDFGSDFSNENDPSLLKRMLFKFINWANPSNYADVKMESTGVSDLNLPAQYSKKDSRALTEVIPGYLAFLVREAQMTRLKVDHLPLVVYDHQKSRFVPQTSLDRSVAKLAIAPRVKAYTAQRLDSLAKEIDPNNELSEDEKRVLKEVLFSNSKDHRRGNLQNLVGSRYISPDNEQHRDRVEAQLIKYFESIDDKKAASFRIKHNDLSASVHDPRQKIQDLIDAGYGPNLVREGVLKERPDGGYEFDIDTYLSDVYSKDGVIQEKPDVTESLTQRRRVKRPGQSGKESTTSHKTYHTNTATHSASSQVNVSVLDLLDKSKATPMHVHVVNMNDTSEPEQPKEEFSLSEAFTKLFGDLTTANTHLANLEDLAKASAATQAMANAQSLHAGASIFDRFKFGRNKRLAALQMAQLRRMYKTLRRDMRSGQYRSDQRDDMRFDSSFAGFAAAGAYQIGKGVSKAVKFTAETAKKGLEWNSKLVSGLFGKAKNWWQNGIYDVYVEGDPQVRLLASKFLTGEYFTPAGQPIHTPGEITTEVRDRNGQVVLTAEEVGKMYVYDPKTRALRALTSSRSKLASMAGAAKDAVLKYYPIAMRKQLDAMRFVRDKATALFGKAKGMVSEFVDPPVDIYTINDMQSPKLLARLMRAGRYFDSYSGEVIRTPGDIKGPVKDENGEIVLSLDDLKIGIVDKDGNAILTKAEKTRNKIKAGVSRIYSVLHAGYKLTEKLVKGGLSGIRRLFGDWSVEFSGKKTAGILEQIRDFLFIKFGQDIDLSQFSDEKYGLTGGGRSRGGGLREIKDAAQAVSDARDKAEEMVGKAKDTWTNRSEEGGLYDKMNPLNWKLFKSSKTVKEQLQQAKEKIEQSEVGQKIKTAAQEARDKAQQARDSAKDSDTLQNLKDKVDTLVRRVKPSAPDENFVGPVDQRPLSQRMGARIENTMGSARGFFGKLFAGKMPKILPQMTSQQATELYTARSTALLSELSERFKKYFDRSKVQSDNDGDGVRDNSMMDRLRKSKEAMKERLAKWKEKRQAPKEEKKDNGGGGILGLLGSIGSTLDTLKNVFLGSFGLTKGAGMLAGRTAAGAAGLIGRGAMAAAPVVGRAAMMSVPLLFKGALAATGAVASAGVGAVGAVAGATVGAIGGLLAFLSSPVVLGAGALALTAYAGVQGYKYWKKSRLTPFKKLRYTQYGFLPQEQEWAFKVFQLEEAVSAFIRTGKDGVWLEEYDMDVKKMLGIFGLNAENEDHLTLFFEWFQARFKPVLLTHAASMFAITGKTNLAEEDSLEGADLFRLFEAVKFLEGPYDFSRLPLLQEEVRASNRADVERVANEIYKELDIEKAGKLVDKASAGIVAKKAAQQARDSDKDSYAQSQKRLVDEFRADAAAGSERKDLTKIKIDPTKMSPAILNARKVDALESVRMKAYGLIKFTNAEVYSLKRLESKVLPDLKLNGTSLGWEGNLKHLLSDTAGDFGVSLKNQEHLTQWMAWFEQRFLPVFLQYATSYKNETGSLDSLLDPILLAPDKAWRIAKAINSVSGIWTVKDSPWPGLSLNQDSASTKDNLAYLEQNSKQAELAQQAAKAPTKGAVAAAKTDSKDPTSAAVKPAQKSLGEKFAGLFGFGPKEAEVKPTPSVTGGSKGTTVTAPSTLPKAGGPLASGEGAGDAFTLNPGVKLQGVNPEFLTLVLGAIEEYYKLTGKKAIITDGFRTYEDQVATKRKYGARAAEPGNSPHEFGLGMDINSADLNAMERLGLLRKYGLTRPIGQEPWHLEPAGIQSDPEGYKRRPNEASAAIKWGVGKGGGGYAMLPSAIKYGRNKEVAMAALKAGSQEVTPQPQGDKAKEANAAPTPTPTPAPSQNPVNTPKPTTSQALAQHQDPAPARADNKPLAPTAQPGAAPEKPTPAKQDNKGKKEASTGEPNATDVQPKLSINRPISPVSVAMPIQEQTPSQSAKKQAQAPSVTPIEPEKKAPTIQQTTRRTNQLPPTQAAPTTTFSSPDELVEVGKKQLAVQVEMRDLLKAMAGSLVELTKRPVPAAPEATKPAAKPSAPQRQPASFTPVKSSISTRSGIVLDI